MQMQLHGGCVDVDLVYIYLYFVPMFACEYLNVWGLDANAIAWRMWV